MSTTMARQGGQEQLEQSDMCLALKMGKMAKGGFSRGAREETQQLIEKPRAEVREENKRGVEFPRHQKVKAAMERQLAMVYKNHTAGCLPCQNDTETIRRHAGAGKELPLLHQNRRHLCPEGHDRPESRQATR